MTKIYLSSEKYRLELHWDRIVYSSDNVARLENAYFSGPVFNMDDVEIQAPDFMDLDFTEQHSKLFSDFHIARISWDSLERVGKRVTLGRAVIGTNHENEVCSLSKDDYLVIDTKEHDTKRMSYRKGKSLQFNLPLVYKAYIVKESGEDKYE
jgi:hypothetical protein